jgi:hypothetical protein
MNCRMLLMLGLAVACVGVVHADEVAVGTKIENLTFKDIRYLNRTLDDFNSPKLYVLTFITNACPLAQRYLPKVAELDKEFAAKGVQFVFVNTGGVDSIMDMAQQMLDYKIEVPVVKDVKGAVSKACGITRTPETIVLDAERKIRYRGRVDDQYRLGGVRPEPTRNDLREAITELLDGKEVSVPATVSEGCLITYPELPKPAETITYNKHIAPILNQNCVQCHHKGGSGPISLDTYAKASGNGEMIEEVTSEGRMPPWYANKSSIEFEHDDRLTPEERTLIAQWVAGGMPQGDGPDPEPATISQSEWRIEPDIITEAPSPVGIAATGFMPYVFVLLPQKFEQDTWIEAIEIKASNPRVMHHANLGYLKEGFEVSKSESFLTGQVPGGQPLTGPPGYAGLIPKGATLALQLHYVTTGKPEVDRPRVALRFARGPVKKRVYYKVMDAGKRISIPPFARAHPISADATLETDATLGLLFSHMHLRGRDSTFTAYYPDGNSEVLLSLPNYNFDWQLQYRVTPDTKILPEGTRVEVVSHFDNSTFNPYNPDPAREVPNGEQTVDEMMQCFMSYTKNDEHLNVQVDPTTGWEIQSLALNNQPTDSK